MPTRQTTVNTYDTNGNVTGTRTITYEVTASRDNEETIRSQAQQALATNRAFIALANPTNAQVIAQVKALSRQHNGLIRLILGQLDATD